MPDRRPDLPPLVAVAAVSGLYDVLLGLVVLAGQGLLTSLFDLPLPAPAIHADLNGLFLIAVGIGYVLPLRRPDLYRGYLWVMGPLLKGLGCVLFLADHFVRHSPDAYLLFAATDGLLALVTLLVLLRPATGR